MDVRTPVSPDELLAHRHALTRLARGLVLDEGCVDDLLQETWLAALRRPPRHRENLRGWLKTVTRRVARRQRLTRMRAWTREREAARPEGVDWGAREQLEHDAALARVKRHVDALAEPYRTVVRLRFFEELPIAQIAERLGRPVNTVKSQVLRALERLRLELDRQSQGDRSRWLAALASATLPQASPPALPPGKPPPERPRAGPFLRGWRLAAAALVVPSAAIVALLGVANRPWGATRTAPAASAAPGASAARAGEALAATGPRSLRAPGSEPPAGKEPVASTRRRVEVSVIDDRARPVPGATVAVVQADDRAEPRARTDEHGRGSFSVSDADFHSAFADAEAGPRVPLVAWIAGRSASSVHHVPLSPADTTRLRLALGGPDLTLHGRVLDDLGAPVAGARVRLEPRGRCQTTTADGIVLTPFLCPTITDAAGGFELRHLPPDSHPLRAEAAGYVSTRVTLDGAREASVECTLVLGRGGELAGTAAYPDGRPAAGARVWVDPGEPRPPRAATTCDAAGRFRLAGLAPGRHVVWAQSMDAPEHVASAELTIPAGDAERWDAALERTPGLHVATVDERGTRLAGCFVYVLPVDPRVAWRRIGISDARGELHLFDCPDLPLRAHVLRSALRMGFPAASREVRADGALRVIELGGDEDPGSFEGCLVDARGRPLAEGQVRVTGASRITQGFLPDAEGRFRVEPLPPGRYEVYVFEAARGEALLGTWDVDAGQTLDLGTLRAPEPGRLFVDAPPDGLAAGYRLVKHRLDPTQWFPEVLDEGSGPPPRRYELFPGEYSFELVSRGELVCERRVRVGAGEDVSVDLPR